MDFNDFLNEKNFQVVTNFNAINYRLTLRHGEIGFVAMASSGKELDKEIEIDNKQEIAKAIEESINRELKKRRQLFTVKLDPSYKGAGHGFDLDMDYLLELLNK